VTATATKCPESADRTVAATVAAVPPTLGRPRFRCGGAESRLACGSRPPR